MSDQMLFGVLQMPYEMAMSDEISRAQFYGRAQQAVARIKELEKIVRDQRVQNINLTESIYNYNETIEFLNRNFDAQTKQIEQLETNQKRNDKQ